LHEALSTNKNNHPLEEREIVSSSPEVAKL
jgi:hypothetical protein